MTQYISKSALVAEIERRRDLHYKYYMKNGAGSIAECKYDEDREILSFLDTLEVKEVDFDNDLFEEVYSHLDGIRDTADRMTSGNFMHHRAAIKFSANVIEKVLGLIGLKAKGE